MFKFTSLPGLQKIGTMRLGLELILSSRKYILRKPSVKEFKEFSGYITSDNTTTQKYFKALVSLLATFGRCKQVIWACAASLWPRQKNSKAPFPCFHLWQLLIWRTLKPTKNDWPNEITSPAFYKSRGVSRHSSVQFQLAIKARDASSSVKRSHAMRTAGFQR